MRGEGQSLIFMLFCVLYLYYEKKKRRHDVETVRRDKLVCFLLLFILSGSSAASGVAEVV